MAKEAESRAAVRRRERRGGGGREKMEDG